MAYALSRLSQRSQVEKKIFKYENSQILNFINMDKYCNTPFLYFSLESTLFAGRLSFHLQNSCSFPVVPILNTVPRQATNLSKVVQVGQYWRLDARATKTME